MLKRAMIINRVVGIAEIVLGIKQELVALFYNSDCTIATILSYEDEINEIPTIEKCKIDKIKLEKLKCEIANHKKDFNWSSHYDKYQEKLKILIKNKIPKK